MRSGVVPGTTMGAGSQADAQRAALGVLPGGDEKPDSTPKAAVLSLSPPG